MNPANSFFTFLCSRRPQVHFQHFLGSADAQEFVVDAELLLLALYPVQVHDRQLDVGDLAPFVAM